MTDVDTATVQIFRRSTGGGGGGGDTGDEEKLVIEEEPEVMTPPVEPQVISPPAPPQEVIVPAEPPVAAPLPFTGGNAMAIITAGLALAGLGAVLRRRL